MKPCILVTLDYPPEQGGVARYLGNLVRASQGGITEVITPTGHAVTGPGAVRTMDFFWPYWPHWAPLTLFFLKERTQKTPPVFLLSHVLPIGTAAWLASLVRPVSYSILLHGLDLRLALQSRWKKRLLGRILRRATSVVTNSQFVSSEVMQAFPGQITTVVSPGVEEIFFPPRLAARQRYALKEGTVQLLAVTRLVPRKGLDQLLKAMRLLPLRVELTIIGAGNDEQRLRRLAQPLGERVRFETTISDVDRNAWYASADIFVLPTRDEGADVEGFGIVFLEAALAGLPTIAGRSGGVVEAVIDKETGILVDPLDPQAIATALQTLIDDPLLAERYGAQGRSRAQSAFRWSERWQKLARLLEL